MSVVRVVIDRVATLIKTVMNRINIYLTPKDKKTLVGYKDKYHLSFSTIANICTKLIYMVMNEELTSGYFYNDKGTKTSIKPRSNFDYGKKSMAYTNALVMFLRKDTKKYLGDKNDKVLNMIYSEMQNTYEENYNGNVLSRFIPKFIKQNPEYTKKLLKIE